MALNNAQYDEIMLSYARSRSAHRREAERREEEVYERIPAYAALEQRIPEIAAEAGRAYLGGDKSAKEQLDTRIREVRKEQAALLSANGFPEDYLTPQNDCPLCMDTGYTNGARCECLKQKIRDLMYEQSHLRTLSQENNFSLMREDYYTGEDLRRFHGALTQCNRLLDSFRSGQPAGSLLFFGPVGSGKSFLSVATATEVLNAGYSVLYFSSVTLFSHLSDVTFGQGMQELRRHLENDLTECDLLVIDDLGTELPNAFVSTQLFHLINERHLARRSTVISTNLEFDELRNRYSDRIFSRLMHDFTLCELTGRDIRLAKATA
ncbi:MAG: ATP-binding protein [Lachnospiraceae bacterium]|nr:ATP-binding protein [Lachnospiraceae bacterium]